MRRVAGDDSRGVAHIFQSEGRRRRGELSLSFQAALALTKSFVGSCLYSSVAVGCLEVEVDRLGRDLGQKLKRSRRPPLHLVAHILFEEQLNMGNFDPLASTVLIYGLSV